MKKIIKNIRKTEVGRTGSDKAVAVDGRRNNNNREVDGGGGGRLVE